MLIKFTSDMDFVDFLESLNDLDVLSVDANRDELEVKVGKEDLLGALEVSEDELEVEMATLYCGNIEDWNDD